MKYCTRATQKKRPVTLYVSIDNKQNRATAVTVAESEVDMNRNNASRMIKDIMKKCNVKQYEVADYLGIRESNFSRDLRYYMTPNRQIEIIVAIKKNT